MPPFRSKAEEELSLPSWAKPISSEEGLPDWAKPVKQEEKKSSLFSKPKPFKATGDYKPTEEDKAKSAARDKMSVEELAVNPLSWEEKKKPSEVFSKSVSAASKPDERKDNSAIGFDQDKWTNIASKLPESWHGIPIRKPAAFIGSLAGTALENLSDPVAIAAMGAGAGAKALKELPIRRPIRIPENIPRKEQLREKPPEFAPTGGYGSEVLKPTPKKPDFVNPFEKKPEVSFAKRAEEAFKPPEWAKSVKESRSWSDLPKGSKEGTRKVPFDTIEDKEASKIYRATKFDKPEIKEVPVKDLISTQGEVQEDLVKKYVGRSTTEETPELTNTAREAGENVLPTVSEHEGKFYLSDGTHRAVADWSEGKETVKAYVYPVDKELVDKPKSVFKSPFSKRESLDISRTQERGTTPSTAEEIQIEVDKQLAKNAKVPAARNLRDTISKIPEVVSEGAYDASRKPSLAGSVKKFIEEDKGEFNPEALSLPDWAKPVETNASGESAASMEAMNRQKSMASKKEQYVVYDRSGKARPLIGPEAVDYVARKGETYGIQDSSGRFRTLDDKGGRVTPEGITQMHGGLGGVGEGSFPPSEGPHGPLLDRLFNALTEAKGLSAEQQTINKAERARRFAASASVKEEGVEGAKRSLSALKGKFEKVDQGEGLRWLNPKDTDTLFTAVKKANITEGEKARGYTALFKMLNGEGSVPQRNELKILDDVFGNGFADRITMMHGGIGAAGLKVAKAANTMKSMENALSLAAPLRHGAGLIHRKEFYPAFADMFKFFGNKEYFNTAMKAIEEKPNYMLGRESGLFISKSGSFLNSEEEFLNSYVGSLPKFTGIPQTVGASQRAYMGFLNKLRSDTFDGMIKTMKSLGYETDTRVGDSIVPAKETRAIAAYINNATGRGDLGSLNKMTNELNTLLWSPRMIASRIGMFKEAVYPSLPKGMRMEGLKSLLGIASMGLTINGLGILGGATVGTNILSSDFMKSRFGNRVIDPNAGLQQYVVAAARFLAGKTDSNTPTSRLEIAGRFLANKESPAASLAHSILTAKKFTGGGSYKTEYGQETSIQSETAKRFLPIFLQDLKELSETETDFSKNIGLDVAMGAASLAGMSQEYPEKRTSKLHLGKMKR